MSDLKDNATEILTWFKELAVTFGKFLLVLYVIYYGCRKIWAWIVLPILFFVFLKQIALIGGYTFVDQIYISYLVVSWVFVFSVLKKFGSVCFEKKTKK